MSFDPVLADIRFGCGLSPVIAPPESAAAMLQGLRAPDTMAARFPIEDYDTFRLRIDARNAQILIRRQNRGTEQAQAAIKASRRMNADARRAHLKWMAASLLRRSYSSTPFLERLEDFWADHFTATGKQGLLRRATSPYIESAVRPHLTGLFEDLLIAAVTHSVMVTYLDQDRSIGPNSVQAQRSGKGGLNENLAREILELHSLGVDGPYTQTDVRELAELLTGLTLQGPNGTRFRKDMTEPGPETVLGKVYGGDNPHIRDIEAVLRDLARHPATARHLAGKLAVHFVSDTPDPDIAARIEQALLDSGMDLTAGYDALLTHPAAWATDRPNVKPPFGFIASALRALAVPPEALLDMDERTYRQRIQAPLGLMGHVWQKPDGPDGLDEQDSAWITPQGLAARLQWAVAVPQLLQRDLPDPRVFVETALATRATAAVRFAAEAAESRADGIGLILASPAFQRM